MKAFAVILVVCLAQGLQATLLTENPDSSLTDYMKACLAQSDLDAGLINELLKYDPKLNVPQKKLNCFVACMYQKLGVLSADGTILTITSSDELIIDWSPELIEKCKKQAGNDVCELAGCLEEVSKMFT